MKYSIDSSANNCRNRPKMRECKTPCGYGWLKEFLLSLLYRQVPNEIYNVASDATVPEILSLFQA